MKKKTHQILPNWEFSIETIESVTKRYNGFGYKLFQKLKQYHPNIYSKVVFYRSKTYQSEDVYAVCEGIPNEFMIQLDPDCEVIVLSNGKNTVEIGSWSDDEYIEAIECIIRLYSSSMAVKPA
ncbi:MAG: hypothetical protein HOE80_03365 [Candidatus Magasanikbacteria bacterium]|jgi:hypothetical protein|nr:hypothetical protein [Candidatus Magasanikbacteria bacterium]MBT4071736.1 hypothetical protein [Candidatus Magasanikbacteria bacterium]